MTGLYLVSCQKKRLWESDRGFCPLAGGTAVDREKYVCLRRANPCRLGGPDPLDYISMYANPGDPARGIPAHWHYVSFGLSDLHGDGRVHQWVYLFIGVKIAYIYQP